MLELFIEMADQVFWDGYSNQLATDNPQVFQSRFQQFVDSLQENQSSGHQSYFNNIILNNYKLQ